jgi:hypothetical protein
MVYSSVCDWLDDYLADDATELYDTWDFMEWVEETEIAEVFKECLLTTLSRKESKKDATAIFYSLLWEYYLLKRDSSLARIEPDTKLYPRLSIASSVPQQSDQWFKEKRNLLTASEFYIVLDKTKLRRDLLMSKVAHRISSPEKEQTVFLSNGRRLGSMAWGHRYESVIRQVYSQHVAKGEVRDCGRYYHSTLKRLAASPDGIVISGPRTGRLLEIKAPVSREIETEMVPEPYYTQVQIQLEVCDAAVADYCECRISAGSTWRLAEGAGGPFVGAVAVIGTMEKSADWHYEYSPLFPNTAEGRAEAEAWTPAGDVLEKELWAVEALQTVTFQRNPRWWATVGLPAYNEFWTDVDKARNNPQFLAPAFHDDAESPVPTEAMFIDN